jgi:hypothetical protein
VPEIERRTNDADASRSKRVCRKVCGRETEFVLALLSAYIIHTGWTAIGNLEHQLLDI